jgi:hypothetical protein
MDQIAIIAVDAWSNLLLHCKAYIICICGLIEYTEETGIRNLKNCRNVFLWSYARCISTMWMSCGEDDVA